MGPTNEHGLSRDIPEAIKRAVRRRCGFGCVVCGSAIYQYEHLAPTFANAKTHDPGEIVLLCGGCHDRVTRKFLSKETVNGAAANPRALQKGYSFGAFDLGTIHPDVLLGPVRTIRTTTIVEAFGIPLLRVAPPEASGAPFRISALLCDSNGKEILRVAENEWQTPIENWDAEVTGGRIILRRSANDITLRLRTVPPSELIVEKMRMFYRGALIECTEADGLSVTSPDGGVLHASVMTAVECEAGISVRENGIGVGYKCKGGVLLTADVGSARPPALG